MLGITNACSDAPTNSDWPTTNSYHRAGGNKYLNPGAAWKGGQVALETRSAGSAGSGVIPPRRISLATHNCGITFKSVRQAYIILKHVPRTWEPAYYAMTDPGATVLTGVGAKRRAASSFARSCRLLPRPKINCIVNEMNAKGSELRVQDALPRRTTRPQAADVWAQNYLVTRMQPQRTARCEHFSCLQANRDVALTCWPSGLPSAWGTLLRMRHVFLQGSGFL